MDAVVYKPIERAKLGAALERLNHQGFNFSSNGSSGRRASDTSPYVSIRTIETIAAATSPLSVQH